MITNHNQLITSVGVCCSIFNLLIYHCELIVIATFAAHLIGHEGPGSLLSELKRRGWVNSLSAGDRVMARGMSCFQVTVDLSEGYC